MYLDGKLISSFHLGFIEAECQLYLWFSLHILRFFFVVLYFPLLSDKAIVICEQVKVEDMDAYAPKDLLIVTTGSQVGHSSLFC